jgi:hypothetical protein
MYENTTNPSVVAFLKPSELNLNNNNAIVSISSFSGPRITLTNNGVSASISSGSNGELLIKGTFPTLSAVGSGTVYVSNGYLMIA